TRLMRAAPCGVVFPNRLHPAAGLVECCYEHISRLFLWRASAFSFGPNSCRAVDLGLRSTVAKRRRSYTRRTFSFPGDVLEGKPQARSTYHRWVVAAVSKRDFCRTYHGSMGVGMLTAG